jgi:hypothetical protein
MVPGTRAAALVSLCFLMACGRIGFEQVENDSPDGAASTVDGASEGDAESPVLDTCTGPLEGPMIALWTFEEPGNLGVDAVAGIQAQVVGNPQVEPGPDDCGSALAFDGDTYLTFPELPGWTHEEGSIDFWFRPGTIALQGLVSRDALMPNAGDILFMMTSSGRVTFRMQANGEDRVYLCSEPLTVNSWVHIGASFDAQGAQLWVNGELATHEAPASGNLPPCGLNEPIDFVDEAEAPWVIGAHTSFGEPDSTPTHGVQEGGAMDHVRFTANAQNFGQ